MLLRSGRTKDVCDKETFGLKEKTVNKGTEPMPWSKISVENGILVVWPGTIVTVSDLTGPKGLYDFFKQVFDIEPMPVGCVTTLPDTDNNGTEIEGTGGRIDFFFFIQASDVLKFAFKRLSFGMRWWEDIYFNNTEDIYPMNFRQVYPNPCI